MYPNNSDVNRIFWKGFLMFLLFFLFLFLMINWILVGWWCLLYLLLLLLLTTTTYSFITDIIFSYFNPKD